MAALHKIPNMPMREKGVADRIVLEQALETLRERVSKPDYDDRS